MGIAQVCPDRSGMELSRVFTETIAGAVAASGGAAFDEAAAMRAAAPVCAALGAGEGADRALVSIAVSMFGADVAVFEDLDSALGSDEGVVVGAVLAASTALLCPEHITAVESFLEGL